MDLNKKYTFIIYIYRFRDLYSNLCVLLSMHQHTHKNNEHT